MMNGHETPCRRHGLPRAVVGEHSNRQRRHIVRYAGAVGKADVGISNDNAGQKPAHRKPKGS